MERLFIILVLFLAVFAGHASEIEVCKTCEISSIQKAIDFAEDGDLIRIKSGIYKENGIQILNKSLKIIGENYPVIDAEMQGTALSISANNFSIEGLKIINVGKSHTEEFAGILVSQSRNFKILNNKLDNVFFGILLEKSNEGVISGNHITSNARSQSNSGNGIHLWNTNKVEIRNNKIVGLRDGIYLEFVNNSEISGNFCKDNLRYGLHFMFSDEDIYTDNIFENNGAGVAVMYSKFIEMRGNHFRKNWGSASYGLLLKEITDSKLENNIFEENTIAISADNTNRIEYLKNDFKNNGYAVRIRGACYDNFFKENNFLYNSFDIGYTGRLNNNEFTENYWSAYTGYDLDKNGIGDVPYRPVKLFSYLVNRTPEAIILLRSLFIDLLDFSEKVSPVFTPANLMDSQPLMKKVSW
ncbi:nitrous oxidase accessory protein [Salegentibacter echinorum]|uniref:Nitrous oxidase accessory protein n=1 Tax=Salegentibacter echinorum TaxID=1073325 RepID=A0A1M5EC18_SALEC|nr:nitrous oxide reductase family maturation protein NosD [Salegentibacter echinorum]SHF76700.1 nitrous oxidase accessory protein [Salegentibacter echinorum]